MRKTQKVHFAYKNAVKLTDEELAKVVGGYVQFVKIDDGDLIDITPVRPNIDVLPLGSVCVKCNAQCTTDESGRVVIVGEDPLCSHEWN